MTTTAETTSPRRAALRAFAESMGHGGTSKLARDLGYRNASFIVQMIGPNPSREITEKTVRKFEDSLKVPKGTLEDPARVREFLNAARRPAPAPQETVIQHQPNLSMPLTADIIRLVGQVCEAENVPLQPMRFADLVALALTDAGEHGGQARPEHVRALVRLTKS